MLLRAKRATADLFYTKLQAYIHTALAATARKICDQNRANSHDSIYCVNLEDILKKANNHFLQPLITCMQHAILFSVWPPNFSAPVFKNFSQNPIKHGLTHQSFLHYIFVQILIICHHNYCVGVVEHSKSIHT